MHNELIIYLSVPLIMYAQNVHNIIFATMKKTLLTLLILVGIVPVGVSQVPSGNFLFEGYQVATVYFDGYEVTEKVNFNFIDNQLYFIDAKDGEEKIVTNLDKVLQLETDGRTFLFDRDGPKEVICISPLLYVRYNVKTMKSGVAVAYDGVSHVSTSTQYRGHNPGDASNSFAKKEDREVVEVYNDYWLVKGKKKNKFSNFNQFQKLYSKQSPELKKFVKEKGIEFGDTKAVAALVQYAESLLPKN